MNKKKNLLNLFTQDVSYNYHVIKTDEPEGHLIYLIKSDSKLDKELYEFYPTLIAEQLISECNVKIEKFAPSIFFTEETNTEKLKYLLNDKLSESEEFSAFIEEIKDEYRILEVKDSLLYKKDPEEYEEARRKEHEEHQKELWGEMIEQMKNKKKKREDALLAYNNDFFKLLKEYLESIIEYEKRDFDLTKEVEKLISSLIDPETWIKINDQPYICRVEVCSLEKDRLNVYLTDNNDYSYTATLRFDKTVLLTENVERINQGDELPVTMNDYQVLIQLYDVDITNVENWDLMNHTDRFEYVIDYLAPIFKAEKDKRQKEILDKILAEEKEDEDVEDEDVEDEDDNDENDNNMKYSDKTSDWYFDVWVSDGNGFGDEPSMVALSEDGSGLDDQLGSHNLPKSIKKALKRAGVYGDSELMEAVWEVNDYESKTKEEIIEAMENEGFIYSEGLLG